MQESILQYVQNKSCLFCAFMNDNYCYDTFLDVENIIKENDTIVIACVSNGNEQDFQINMNNLDNVREQEDENGKYLIINFKNHESLTIK